jgi:hypothetical protein
MPTSLDAYTYLGLSSGNEYNIRASLYNSADVLKLRDSNIKSQKLGRDLQETS